MAPTILERDNPLLRKIAAAVPLSEITGPKIKRVVKDMKNALLAEPDGAAIAAPQIGESLRIFVVSRRVFDGSFENDEENPEIKKKREAAIVHADLVFINPVIKKLSRKKEWFPEGCLSVRWLYGKTHRALRSTIEAYDENGVKFTRGASGLLAQIFQHEVDHLDGILFSDHAKDVQEIKPEDMKTDKK